MAPRPTKLKSKILVHYILNQTENAYHKPVFDPLKFLSDLFKNPRSCKTGEKILPVISCHDRVNILVPFNHFCVISGFHLKIIISKNLRKFQFLKASKIEKSDRSCCQKLKFSKGLYLITSFMHKIFACLSYHFSSSNRLGRVDKGGPIDRWGKCGRCPLTYEK